MPKYFATIQSITRLERDTYRLTFRLEEEDPEVEDAPGLNPPRSVYTAEIRLNEKGFSADPEDDLRECMRLLEEDPDPKILGEEVYRKYVVGTIADRIFERVREDMTLCTRSWIESDATFSRDEPPRDIDDFENDMRKGK